MLGTPLSSLLELAKLLGHSTSTPMAKFTLGGKKLVSLLTLTPYTWDPNVPEVSEEGGSMTVTQPWDWHR